MVNREIADKFLNSLVTTLNKASLYQPTHPLFLKAAEGFREKLESAFDVIKPLAIGITINSLVIESEVFSIPAYRELAKKLHLYRIKGIEITPGITSEELAYFINKLSLPIKEVFKAGGIANILSKEMTPHLIIRRLDYSELLTKDAGEYKDIWPYLLEEAVSSSDDSKVIKLAEDFGKMISCYAISELLGDIQILENIRNFLTYLKSKDRDKFLRCAREIAQHILKNKDLSEEEINKLKVLFDSFSEDDFAEILSSEIFDVDRLGDFNLDLFSRIIGAQKLTKVIALTLEHIRDNFIGNKQKLKHKIEHLFSSLADPELTRIYLDTFAPILESISLAGDTIFERNAIRFNCRLIVLQLLLCMTAEEYPEVIKREVAEELKKMNKDVDLEYLDMLVGIMAERKKTMAKEEMASFGEIDRLVTALIENSAWDAHFDGFQHLIDYPESSVMGVKFYLDKMFTEGKINTAGLKLFLKFFPNNLNLFYEQISKRKNIELGEKIIAVIKKLENGLASSMLEEIYLFSGTYIKIEILRAMGELGIYRSEFFIDVLLKEEIPLKQEALFILMKDEEKRQEALRAIFSIDNPWRVNTVALLANIKLIEELGLRDARDYLSAVNKKLFFWHWRIKREIKRVIDKWK